MPSAKTAKVIKCDNCGDVIYADQERHVAKNKRGTGIMVFHKDHTGCVDSLRRRQDRSYGK